MNFFLTIVLDGLIQASWLFIVALGLTLVFGVLKILNIAHGSFYALGAYIAATAVTLAAAHSLPPSIGFVAMLVSVALIASAVGLLLERGLLKMFYGRDEVVLLLVTYAVFLILEDATKLIWGVNPIYATQPYELFGTFELAGLYYVGYDLVLIPISAAIGFLVWYGLNRTITGKIVLAVIHNEEMSVSMGVRVNRVYAVAFAFGVLLAATAGALTAPKISMQPGLSSDVIILSFAIVVIGGLGSVEGAAVGALLVGLARAASVHLMPQAELFVIYLIMAAVLMFRPEGLFKREMKQGLHPLVMIALVAAATLFGRVLPTWTLSLATVAASNALIALGIVVLARTGNVSFGQGLFFAAGGYGVALIANAWGLTDAVAQMLIGAVCGGLLGLVIGPLIARYSGIFFGMLTLALSMVFYGALVKSTALGGSDGFNVGRPSLFGMIFTDPREADFMLYAVSVVTTGLAGIAATILFRSELGLISLAVRENNLRVEYLGISASRVITINFIIAAVFAGASGAFALMAQRHIDPQFAYWTTSGEFVFIAVLAGYQSVAAVFVASMALELVRSFSNLYLPNTWQLVLGVFLLGVILFLPRGIGSLWIRKRRKRIEPAAAAPVAVQKEAAQ
jgi:branched-chain amino acid transport system permease protein